MKLLIFRREKKSKHRWPLVWLAVLTISFGTLQAAPSRPNIILCMADDHGWGDVGYQGHPFISTPNLDQMAAEGIQFDRWYAAAPVCSPTRGSCLTGRHPYRYGIYSANVGHLKDQEITLAEILKQQGYATGHFGKWHLGTLTRRIRDANRGGTEKGKGHYSPPWQNGFDDCFSTESKVPTFDPMRNPASVSREAKRNVPVGGSYGTSYWTGPDKRVPEADLRGDDSKLIMDQALQFISKAVHQKKPFFAVIWFHAPHTPVVADASHRNLYSDHPFGLYGQHYHGCLSALDDQLGRLRDHLESKGVSNHTMLCYCADNGPESSVDKGAGTTGPFRGRKRSLYEGGVRVPALLVWPDQIKTPFKTKVPCVTSDYFPTILDALGLPLPNRPYDGISLMPLIQRKTRQRTEPICFQSRKVAALHQGRFKLVSHVTSLESIHPGRNELYDLAADPGEREDVASKHPQLVTRLGQKLRVWIESCHQSDTGNDY